MSDRLCGTLSTTIDVNVPVACTTEDVPLNLLENLRYIDASKVVNGNLEIGTMEVNEKLLLTSVTVEQSQVITINMHGTGIKRVTDDHPFFGPIIKEVARRKGINIEKPGTQSLSIESFIESITRRSEREDDCIIHRTKTEIPLPIGIGSIYIVCGFACGKVAGCYSYYWWH